jgi:KipI family sensor histidine kinase inhibitor
MRIRRMADRGLVVEFEAAPSRDLTARMMGFVAAVHKIEGVVDSAPGHRTVLVEVEPEAAAPVADLLPQLVEDTAPIEGRLHEVDVRYDGEDVEWACRRLGLTLTDLVRIHSGPEYDVKMIGSPGFIYLSEVDALLWLPRLDDPRRSVPAGRFGIGGRQTGIYGRARPGGWRLIGTVVEVPKVRPGDRVRFLPA